VPFRFFPALSFWLQKGVAVQLVAEKAVKGERSKGDSGFPSLWSDFLFRFLCLVSISPICVVLPFPSLSFCLALFFFFFFLCFVFCFFLRWLEG
jgi:hypothetical protein